MKKRKQMHKVTIEITNSVNDDVVEISRIFTNIEDAEELVAERQKDVDEWNKPEDSPYGGKMSTRYMYSDIEHVDDDTVIDAMTYGDLVDLVQEIARQEIKKKD